MNKRALYYDKSHSYYYEFEPFPRKMKSKKSKSKRFIRRGIDEEYLYYKLTK